MAHVQQLNYIQSIKESYVSYFKNSQVLEIGSLDINGSVRDFFHNCNYIGIDVGPGKGVDIVCEGQDYNEDDNFFDTVISCECFEHNPYWFETFTNMYRMCKNNGLILFTCATTGRPEHGTSRTSPKKSPLTVAKGWDYYRNLTEIDFTEKFNFSKNFSAYEFSTNTESFDLYFYGIKK